MMAELCYHIIDLAQNSATADSDNIFIRLEDSLAKDLILMEIKDDGKGMDAETVINVQDPFFTTKSTKKVGLGVPLLKEAAALCDGDFSIISAIGEGTTVRASLRKSHIDRPPVGDLKDTILTLLVSTVGPEDAKIPNVDFEYSTDSGTFRLSINEIKEEVGDVPLSHPEVLTFLRKYISENIDQISGLQDHLLIV
jgi:Histidine kinase-, DNA gyrase B-, and HSP90-like ATPase